VSAQLTSDTVVGRYADALSELRDVLRGEAARIDSVLADLPPTAAADGALAVCSYASAIARCYERLQVEVGRVGEITEEMMPVYRALGLNVA
jgi:hypothetical protein